ncbi:MAG TPA: ABC transporter ATP-binding protein, partial [Thermomicrobiales bacterium]|nr:ABC transporter ATP-binding protein [Thermomicrobiales bacterium]
MPKLSFRGITKTFGGITAVKDASLDVRRGEFVSLLGGSGCGKTTLLRIIAGLTRPDAGTVHIDGSRVDTLPPGKRDLGFVFQSYALFPTQTVAQNIGFALSLRRRPRVEIARRVAELCELVQLSGLENRYPHELSGGQQQRVALARALAPSPAIMLMDEPLSALDAKIRAHLRAEIRSIVERLGITTVYVTHDQEEALSMSDRVAVMDRGVIRQVGSPMEIYLQPADRFVAEFIGTTNRFPARATGNGSVVIEGHGLTVPVSAAFPAAARCTICVRPEHVDLVRAGDGSGCVEGSVRSVVFMGQMVRVRVATRDEREVVVDASTSEWMSKNIA